jgi:hypothetical protein
MMEDHKGADCWTKEENKDKRPSNYKKKESANIVKEGKSTYHCDYCKKDGHTEDRCFKKKKDPESSKETMMCFIETALLVLAAKLDGKLNDFTFVADTGASSHMVYDDKYLTDIEPVTNEYITAGNAI